MQSDIGDLTKNMDDLTGRTNLKEEPRKYTKAELEKIKPGQRVCFTSDEVMKLVNERQWLWYVVITIIYIFCLSAGLLLAFLVIKLFGKQV